MADFEEKKKQAAEQYSTLTDEELKELAGEAWTLTDAGKQALQDELSRRALEIELAAAPPPEAPQRDLITLRKFRDMPEALLAKGALESAGLESFLMDETTIRMDWLWSNALGGIKLCVKPEDADAAVQLLDQEIPEKFSVEGVGDFEQPRCPQCQSLDISYEDLERRIAHPGLLVGIPIPLKHGRWKCQACGHEWEPIDEPKQAS
jgi:hypothetical protein